MKAIYLHMSNVLFISYDGMTDPLGQSQVLPYLTGLSSHGLHFTLISFEKKSNFDLHRSTIEHICADSRINWIPLSYTKKPPVLSTLWDYLRMIRKARSLHRRLRFDAVHCRSYIAALAGLSLKKSSGLKLVFDMRGFWADERVDGSLWNLKNPVFGAVYRFFKKKERQFLSEADMVISLTDAAKAEMLGWNVPNLYPAKIKVIPCATDFSHFELVSTPSRNEAREILGFSDNDFVLTYIGSTGTWYLLDEMAAFFKVVQKKIANAKFLLLTADDPTAIQRTFANHGIKSADTVIRFAKRSELPGLAHASDLNIFFIKPAYSKTASSPTKLGEMLAMGIPVICNDRVGDVATIVRSTGGGICISDFSLSTFEEVIEGLRSKQFVPEEIRTKAFELLDLNTGVRSYLECYKAVLNGTVITARAGRLVNLVQ